MTRTVNGVETITNLHTGNGGFQMSQSHPDLTGVSVAALVYDGTSFAAPIAGVGALNGTFTIPNVPVGPYYLLLRDSQYKNNYFVTSSDNVDMSYNVLGRALAAEATLPTPLTLDVGNLSAWSSSDRLQVYCPGAGTYGTNVIDAGATGIPTTNATSLAMTIDSSKLAEPFLIDGSAGDLMGLTQMVPMTTPVPYNVVTRFTVPSFFTQTDGQSSVITAAFATLSLGQSATLVWHTTAFEALASATNPAATVVNDGFLVDVSLGDPTMYGIYAATPDLLTFSTPGGGSDVSTQLPFGDPYVSELFLYDEAGTTFLVDQNVPGQPPTPTFATIVYAAPRDTFESAGPIVPKLSPPTSPTIDKNSFYVDGMLASDMPTITWAAPAIGAATAYTVRIQSLSTAGKRSTVATIATDGTSVTVPPGVLSSGNYYIFNIRAMQMAGVDYQSTPSKSVLPQAAASTISGVFGAP